MLEEGSESPKDQKRRSTVYSSAAAMNNSRSGLDEGVDEARKVVVCPGLMSSYWRYR